MAVEFVYRSSDDPENFFMTREEANEHDRKLELAEHLSRMLRFVLPNLSEDDAEDAGIFMAENRDKLAAALKKNPSAILELIQPQELEAGNVVPIADAV